eukprot:TRINITY_DN2309_c0_g1_i1.p2 TRINITY_DN2309_c0_g1~~TRINITY_DN2309_c0_g1_i1.p2  ORF type:complete len:285 (+),score=71.65 TRINITY_DN2309_c0_g1_i1:1115-1969(+)
MAYKALVAIKDANPDMPVMLGGTAGVDFNFIDAVLSEHNFGGLDIVSVHPYRQNNPETYLPSATCAEHVVKSHLGDNVPVVSGEWGYSTYWFGEPTNSEALHQQALYCLREMLFCLYTGRELAVWYDIINDATDNKQEANFGLLIKAGDGTLSPKPSYIALKTWWDLLGIQNATNPDCSYYAVATTATHVRCLLFKCPDTTLAAVWETRDGAAQTVDLRVKHQPAFYDMYGDPYAGVDCATDGVCTLTLHEDSGPVFIVVASPALRTGTCALLLCVALALLTLL